MSESLSSSGRPAAIVSIVIPLYNGARFIDETLRSINRQTLRDFQVVVVDDGSTDDGPAIVRENLSDPRLTLVMKPHMGIARTRNVGAAVASSEARYLIFMDQDDVWDEDLLRTLTEMLEARPDASGAYALADFVDAAGKVVDAGSFAGYMRFREGVEGRVLSARNPTADVRLDELFLTNRVYPPSCLVIRRETFDRLGGFDPRYAVADDWDMVVRLARVGPLLPADRVLVGYRRHGANASGNLQLNVTETRHVWATTFYSPENTKDQRATLQAAWRAHQRRTFRRKASSGLAALGSGAWTVGIRGLADASAHLVLYRPLRRWAFPTRPDHRSQADLAQAHVEVGARA